MAQDLADALRNGLAHTYETKYLKAGSLMIEIGVSWKDHEHLSIRQDPPCIFINIATMRTDLLKAFADTSERLKRMPDSDLQITDYWRKKQIKETTAKSVDLWKALFSPPSSIGT